VQNQSPPRPANTDPRETIDQAPMSLLQMFIIAITVCLNGLDGFDVLSISFASTGIAKEWGMDKAGLGIVLSMELIGMAFGSIILGWVADIIGRRRTMLGCLVTMAVGMFMVTTVGNVTQLSIWRIITGLGIGGLLSAITAISGIFQHKTPSPVRLPHGHRISGFRHYRGRTRPALSRGIRLALHILFRRRHNNLLYPDLLFRRAGIGPLACAQTTGRRIG
jgi:hypothetical protein